MVVVLRCVLGYASVVNSEVWREDAAGLLALTYDFLRARLGQDPVVIIVTVINNPTNTMVTLL